MTYVVQILKLHPCRPSNNWTISSVYSKGEGSCEVHDFLLCLHLPARVIFSLCVSLSRDADDPSQSVRERHAENRGGMTEWSSGRGEN